MAIYEYIASERFSHIPGSSEGLLQSSALSGSAVCACNQQLVRKQATRCATQTALECLTSLPSIKPNWPGYG